MNKKDLVEIPTELKERLQANLRFCSDQLDDPTIENLIEWFSLDEIKEDFQKVNDLIPDEAWEL